VSNAVGVGPVEITLLEQELAGSGNAELAVFTRPDACDHRCHLLCGGLDARPAGGGEHQDREGVGLEVLLIAQVDVGGDQQAVAQLDRQEEELPIGHPRPAVLVGRADQVTAQPVAQGNWCSLVQQDVHYAKATVVLAAACRRTWRACSVVTPWNRSTNCASETPSSRF